MNKFIFTFCLILSCLNTWAQNTKEYREKYEYARKLIDQQKFEQAQIVLTPLVNSEKRNALSPYVMYLYAITSYELGDIDKSQSTLENVSRVYPKWDKIDEVHYMQGVLKVMEGNTPDALMYFSRLNDPSTKADAKSLEKGYLITLPYEDLKAYAQQFPNDEAIGETLLTKILMMPVSERDDALYESLVEKFADDKKEEFFQKKVVYKDTYNVAILFPFFSERVDPTSKKIRNEFVYSIYQGMLMAHEKLAEEGVNIQLLAYDTQRDTTKVKELCNQLEMQNVDLIIGPLYGDIIPIVKNLCSAGKIPMVNPLSSSSTILKDSDQSFLMTSSDSTLGRWLANYHRTQQDTAKAYVVYGHTAKEKAMAEAYKQEFEEKGGEVAVFEEYDPVDGFQRAQEWFEPLALDDSTGFVLDSTSAQVFICTVKEIQSTNTLSALLSQGAIAPIYVPNEWLEFNQVDFRQLEVAKAHVMTPSYMDFDNPKVKRFYSDYQRKYINIANKYAVSGFETMYFFGRMLHRYGKDFPMEIQKNGNERGYLKPAHSYKDAQDNQYVPLIKFERGVWNLLNPPAFNE